jgi:hypothetical protein
MGRWRIDGEDWIKVIKRSPSGMVTRSMRTQFSLRIGSRTIFSINAAAFGE